MTITPKKGILLIKKHKHSHIKADMIVEETDEDKRLITGQVLTYGNKDYPFDTTIIFGKYALFPLTLQGEDFFFIDANDIIGVCDYKENDTFQKLKDNGYYNSKARHDIK